MIGEASFPVSETRPGRQHKRSFYPIRVENKHWNPAIWYLIYLRQLQSSFLYHKGIFTPFGHASSHGELDRVVGGSFAFALPLLLLLLEDLHPVCQGHLGPRVNVGPLLDSYKTSSKHSCFYKDAENCMQMSDFSERLRCMMPYWPNTYFPVQSWGLSMMKTTDLFDLFNLHYWWLTLNFFAPPYHGKWVTSTRMKTKHYSIIRQNAFVSTTHSTHTHKWKHFPQILMQSKRIFFGNEWWSVWSADCRHLCVPLSRFKHLQMFAAFMRKRCLHETVQSRTAAWENKVYCFAEGTKYSSKLIN